MAWMNALPANLSDPDLGTYSSIHSHRGRNAQASIGQQREKQELIQSTANGIFAIENRGAQFHRNLGQGLSSA